MTGLTLDGRYDGTKPIPDENVGFYRRRRRELEDEFGQHDMALYVYRWLVGKATSIRAFADESGVEGASFLIFKVYDVAIYIYYYHKMTMTKKRNNKKKTSRGKGKHVGSPRL
jgi:hypothetical protein